jgi:hypothetical protein
VSCVKPEPVKACYAFFLEHPPTGERNPDRFTCGSYLPAVNGPLAPLSLIANGNNLPFRDPNGLAKYPIDGSRLHDSRAVIQVYRAEDHFTRSVVISEIRLGDWEAEDPT